MAFYAAIFADISLSKYCWRRKK